ncbi:hypothetical protein TKK_0006531 [Trichogramma kaykai]
MDKTTIKIENGLLRGTIIHSDEGYDYYAFKGVPYGKPPIGPLRFKDPVECENWSGVRDATKFGNVCVQFDIMMRKYLGSEDCLYLNVYTKDISPDNLKPVMVWIHGGAFLYDSGNDMHFGPDYLLRKDILLVTFNYRVGIMGFLCLDDEIAPGNQGLKDQAMVLKWIKKNIKYFGGDPDNVTIFGESVGAISAHYHAVSPMSKGLFHKIILQSGSAFNPGARVNDQKKFAYKICTFLGKYSQDSKQMFDLLSKTDALRLVQAQEHIRKSIAKFHAMVPFSPSIDNKSKNPFLPIPVEEAAANGIDVPAIIGYNSREGICCLQDPNNFKAFSKESFSYLDRNFDKTFNPRILELLKSYNLKPKDIRELYFNDEKICLDNCHIYADMGGDLQFVEGIHKAIRIQVQKKSSPTYLYKFSYDDEISTSKSILSLEIPGACHFDEIEYLFNGEFRKLGGFQSLRKGTPGYKVMENLTNLWSNFAIYGDPTPAFLEQKCIKWKTVDDTRNFTCMNINKELKLEIIPNIEEKYKAVSSKIN